jgi:outer membrane protein, heavy metal efflux system
MKMKRDGIGGSFRLASALLVLVMFGTGSGRAGAEEAAVAGTPLPAAGAGSLDQLVADLIANNPDLRSARAAARAARANAGVQGGLAAPQVGVDFFQTPASSFPDPLKGNEEIDYFAQQDVMFPGRLIAMGTAENRRADMLEQDAKLRELRAVRDLKSAYYELYELDRKLEINRSNQDLMRRLQDIARKQYELGMGNQSDVLRAQTEVSSLQNTALILAQSRTAMSAELNALLNRAPDAEVGVIPEQAVPATGWTLMQLSSLAERNQPELKSADSGIEMARAEHGAAFWGFFPDLMVRGMYKDMRGMGENYWSLMAGATLPIFPWALPKTVGGYDRAGAALEQAEADARQARNRVLSQLQQSLSRVRSNQDSLRLTRDTLVPQAEQTLRSTLSAYQTGKRDFMTLLDAYRMVWMARENDVMAVKNLLTSLADLERAVGLSAADIQTALSGAIEPGGQKVD